MFSPAIVMLANENAASEGTSEGDQADVIALAQRWLKAHPESCKLACPTVGQANSRRERQAATQAEQNHEHGSVRCVSKFLGEFNWSKTTVARLLVVDTLHESAKELVTAYESSSSNPHQREGRIGLAAVPALAKLEKVCLSKA